MNELREWNRSRRRRARRRGLRIAAFVALLVFGLAGLSRLLVPYHFLVVDPGVLYRSGLLPPDEIGPVFDRYGIRTVFSLNRPMDDLAERRYAALHDACRARGIRHERLYLETETAPTADELRRWLELIEDQKNHPILVHCRHGVLRTGMFVAIYEMERRGLTGEAVLRDMPRFGHRLNEAKAAMVREFVLGYERRRRERETGQSPAVSDSIRSSTSSEPR